MRAVARCVARGSTQASALARSRCVAPSALALRARCLSSQTAANPTVTGSEAEVHVSALSEQPANASTSDVAAAASSPAAAPTDAVSSDGRSRTAHGLLHPSAKYRVKMMRAIKERDYDQVLVHYDEMLDAGVAPDTLTLNCLIEAKAHNLGTVAARETLKLLLSQHPNLLPNAQTYASLMRPCEHDGDTKMAYELYEEALTQKGLALHVDLFNTLISVCTRARDFTAAENIFEEMREKGVKPKSATYLRYIYACFLRREPDKAYQMLLNMEKEWRVPEQKDYINMHKQFTYANHKKGAERCQQGLMQDLNGLPLKALNPRVVSGLFRDAQSRRDPEAVVKLVEGLAKERVALDRFQTVGAVFAYMQVGQPVQAFSHAIDLYETGSVLPVTASERLVEELAKQASVVDESYFLLESRKAETRTVPLAAVNMIIEACAIMGDLDRAFATWAELEQLELTPDAGTFNALLHTCVRTREIASGRRLLSRMAQDGISPDATTFMHQAALHVMSREQRAALQVVQQCKDAGCVPNARMYVSLINMCVRMRQFDRAQELVEAMVEDGHTVNESLRSKVQGPSRS